MRVTSAALPPERLTSQDAFAELTNDELGPLPLTERILPREDSMATPSDIKAFFSKAYPDQRVFCIDKGSCLIVVGNGEDIEAELILDSARMSILDSYIWLLLTSRPELESKTDTFYLATVPASKEEQFSESPELQSIGCITSESTASIPKHLHEIYRPSLFSRVRGAGVLPFLYIDDDRRKLISLANGETVYRRWIHELMSKGPIGTAAIELLESYGLDHERYILGDW